MKAHADSLPNKAPVPQQVVVAEADELFTYVGNKKNEVYIMTIVDRRTSYILSWHVDGERTQHALQRLVNTLPIIITPAIAYKTALVYSRDGKTAATSGCKLMSTTA